MPDHSALPWLAMRHAMVGALCAALNVGIVYVGDRFLHWPYLAAALMTCLITIPTSYFLHRRHSFRIAARPTWPEFLRFGLQQALQFVGGLACVAAGVELVHLSPAMAMAAATLAMWLFAFAAQSAWVFQGHHRAGAAPTSRPQ